MTTEEMQMEIGGAYIERRNLIKKVDCLKLRLSSFSKTLDVLLDNQLHQESLVMIEKASDPRADWAELAKAFARIAELDKVLS